MCEKQHIWKEVVGGLDQIHVSLCCSNMQSYLSIYLTEMNTQEAVSHHLIRLKWLLYYWNLTKLRVLEGQYPIHCLSSSLNSHATHFISSL